MIWHNLKYIIRRIFNEKAFYGINIFGLVIGIFSFFVLFIYVANEKSFDKHFDDYNYIAGYFICFRIKLYKLNGSQINKT